MKAFKLQYICLFSLLLWLECCYGQATLSINIQGIDDDYLENVILNLSRQDKSIVQSEFLLKEQFVQSEKEIKSTLQALGYYNPFIKKKLVANKSNWIAEYEIKLGPPVIIKKIQIQFSDEGKDNEIYKIALKELPLSVGNKLNHEKYEIIKKQLLDISFNSGYLDATYEVSRLEISPKRNIANIILNLNTGKRYKVGNINYLVNDFDISILKPYEVLTPGEHFHTKYLTEFQNKLIDSLYFSRVDIKLRRDLVENHHIPIDVYLKLRKKYKFSLGLGFNNDLGINGKVRWENRKINDTGHQLTAESDASRIIQNANIAYEIPMTEAILDRLKFTLSREHADTDTSVSFTTKINIKGAKRLENHWIINPYFEFLKERFTVAGKLEYSNLFQSGISGQITKIAPGLFPRRGFHLFGELSAATDGFDSVTQMVRAIISGKKIIPSKLNSRWLLRGEIGAIDANNFDDLPATLRFFTGGYSSIRGYKLNSLAPQDNSGNIIGGKKIFIGSVEYEYRFLPRWSAALFMDIGNAFNNSNVKLKQSAGFGIRWLSPIGPIHVDLGYALSETGNPFRFHFNVGTVL